MVMFLILLFAQQIAADVPAVQLKNAVVDDLTMPAMGLGTGGYGMKKKNYGDYPECWADVVGCADYTIEAVGKWLKAGGRRIDGANGYLTNKPIGKAIKSSGVDRKDIFILNKVAGNSGNNLGYNDTMEQMTHILADLQTDYVDMLLIHWPSAKGSSISKDPLCKLHTPTYNEKECRLATWRALVDLLKAGKARGIGVSNFNTTHIQEIIAAKLPLPAINQCSFNPYHSSVQMDLVKFCQAHDITFLGYSPLGIPDWHKYPGPNMKPVVMQEPAIQAIAKAHGKSAAQVIFSWEWSLGIPVNPRCMNDAHMKENLNSYDFTLTEEESKQIMALHQNTCKEDPTFYECGPT